MEILFLVTFFVCKHVQGRNNEEVEEMEVDTEPTAVIKGEIMLQRLCMAFN